MDAAEPFQEHDSSLEELLQEIIFHENMLRNLVKTPTANSAEEREVIQNVLDELRAKLETIQPLPDWGEVEHTGDDDPQPSLGTQTPSVDEPSEATQQPYPDGSASPCTPRPNSSSGSQKSSGFSEYSSQESPFLTLPSRSGCKRPFDGENDGCAIGGRGNKSRRTTPSPAVTAPTTPASTADSFDFDFADDPVLQQLLGGDLKEQMQDSHKYEKELERKREQEKADEEYARMLQDGYSLPQASFSKPTNLYQATFDPITGALQRSMPPPPRPTIKSETIKSEKDRTDYLPFAGSSSSMSGGFFARDLPSPVSLTDSDSDIEEISASEFTPRRSANRPLGHDPFGAAIPEYSAALTPGLIMPGAYPAPYAGVGGSRVYYPKALNPYASTSIGSNFDLLSAGQKSKASPLDPIDHFSSFRDYRDSLYSDPSKTEEEIKELLAHIRPDEDIDTRSREGTPPQMKLTLMEHQKLGLAWMKKMEEGSNRGGESHTRPLQLLIFVHEPISYHTLRCLERTKAKPSSILTFYVLQVFWQMTWVLERQSKPLL